MNLDDELVGIFLMLSPTVAELVEADLMRFLEDAKADNEPIQVARAMSAIIAISKAQKETAELNQKVT